MSETADKGLLKIAVSALEKRSNRQAAEIRRLTAEVARKDAALEKVNHGATWGGLSRNKLADIARAALNPSQEQPK